MSEKKWLMSTWKKDGHTSGGEESTHIKMENIDGSIIIIKLC